MSFFALYLLQPIFNLLLGLYELLFHDVGLAIIALTVIVRLILWPLSARQIRMQRAMGTLQPKVKALQAHYKDDKEKLAKEMMALYAAEKVNPVSGCLPLLVQLPFLWALYHVLMKGFTSETLAWRYAFLPDPGTVGMISLGFLDLSAKSIPLAVLAGAVQFWQAKMMQVANPPKSVAAAPGAADEKMMAMMNKQMLYFLPLFTVFLGSTFPGGVTLYWLTMTLVAVAQQYWMMRPVPKVIGDRS